MKKIIPLSTAVFIAVSILFSFFIWTIPVLAQTAGVGISPIRFDELVDPGQRLSFQVKVTNNFSEDQTFYPFLRDLKAEGELGVPRLIKPGEEDGSFLASWVDLPEESFYFRAGEEKVITFFVDVPENAGPGGYYGAVLFGSKPGKVDIRSEERGAGMSAAMQTACLLLFRVKGDVYEHAEVREFNTNKDLYGAPYKVDFKLRIENMGNVHIRPHGFIKIRNLFGKEVTTIPVNEKGGNVMPKSIREFPDIYWEGNNGFGWYKASLTLTYGLPADQGGQGQGSMVAAKTFVIIPWKIVIPVMLTVTILAAIFILFLRLYKNKAVQKAMRQAGMKNVRYVKKYQGPSPALHLGVIVLAVTTVLILLGIVLYFLFFA